MDWRQRSMIVLHEEMAAPENCEGPVDHNTGIELKVASAIPTFEEFIAALGQSVDAPSPPITNEDEATFRRSLSRGTSPQFQTPELDDNDPFLPEFFIPSIEGDNTVNRIEDHLVQPGEMEPKVLKTHKEHPAKPSAAHRA
ncbi:hypothetical protein RUND412_011281 [Rhizina undulata]